MQPAGEGLLQQKYEQLKAKLQAEGLFDRQFKNAALTGHCVGAITSKTGAALHDILHVLETPRLPRPLLSIQNRCRGRRCAGRIVPRN